MVLSNGTDGLIEQAHLAYKGNTKFPVVGDTKYPMYLAITNRLIRTWANDSDHLWRSLYAQQSPTVAIIAAGVQTYAMPTTFLRSAESVLVTLTSGQNLTFPVIRPEQRHTITASVFFTGANPQQLNFTDTIATGDVLVGGTILVPGYFAPAALANAIDTVPVLNPDWLVYALASELARNDPAKDDQFSNLIGLANNEYRKMVALNQSGGFDQPAGAGYADVFQSGESF